MVIMVVGGFVYGCEVGGGIMISGYGGVVGWCGVEYIMIGVQLLQGVDGIDLVSMLGIFEIGWEVECIKFGLEHHMQVGEFCEEPMAIVMKIFPSGEEGGGIGMYISDESGG